MAKQAKFYCENCGAEVPQSARFCNKCGRFFSSVRCPVCGKTGSSNLFANGCPSCGYGGKDKPGIAGTGFQSVEDAKDAAVRSKGHFYVHRKAAARASKKDGGDGSLPFWVYIVTFAALMLLLLGIIRCGG